MTLDYEELLRGLTRFTRCAKENNLAPLDFMYLMKWEGKSPYHSLINIDDESSKLSINVDEEYNMLVVHILDSVYLFDDLFTPLSDLNKQAHSVGKSVSDFLCDCDSFAEVRFVISNPEDYFPLVSRDARGTTKNLVYFKEGFIRYTWDTLGRRKAVVILP